MKNFSTAAKKLATSVLILIISAASFAKPNPQHEAICNLKAGLKNKHLVLNWTINPITDFNYCKVQASKDGKNFTTIGLVMDPNPKKVNSFEFKQNCNKLKAGFLYYRVLNVVNDTEAIASNSVAITK